MENLVKDPNKVCFWDLSPLEILYIREKLKSNYGSLSTSSDRATLSSQREEIKSILKKIEEWESFEERSIVMGVVSKLDYESLARQNINTIVDSMVRVPHYFVNCLLNVASAKEGDKNYANKLVLQQALKEGIKNGADIYKAKTLLMLRGRRKANLKEEEAFLDNNIYLSPFEEMRECGTSIILSQSNSEEKERISIKMREFDPYLLLEIGNSIIDLATLQQDRLNQGSGAIIKEEAVRLIKERNEKIKQ